MMSKEDLSCTRPDLGDLLHVTCRSPDGKEKAEGDVAAAEPEEAEAEAVGTEEIATLEASLRPVEKYAMRWVEQVSGFCTSVRQFSSFMAIFPFKYPNLHRSASFMLQLLSKRGSSMDHGSQIEASCA